MPLSERQSRNQPDTSLPASTATQVWQAQQAAALADVREGMGEPGSTGEDEQ